MNQLMGQPTNQRLNKKKVLCADDEPVNLQLLEALLKSNGYDVILAKNGVEALEIIRREPIDLVLLDVKMPKMDGYEVCRIVKGDARFRNIPVIMLTAFTDKTDRKKVREEGDEAKKEAEAYEAEEFLSKPFRITEVLARVKTLLKMKELNDRLQTAYEKIGNLTKTIGENEPKFRNLLERSEKLVTLGEIAAGVAHEIKNRLNIISTSTQLLMAGQDVNEETMESYGAIVGQVDGASELLDNLREFASQKEPEIRKIDLNELITKTVSLVSYEMKAENITIAMNFKQYAAYVNGDPGQLALAFLNIIDNARKRLNAMEETFSYEMSEKLEKLNEDGLANWAGCLKIDVWEDRESIERSAQESVRQSVYVNFEDNGTEIPGTAIDGIFDQFFTAKSEGESTGAGVDESTGLGLSIAYGIIKNHNGDMKVKSMKGKTVFTVRFPVLINE
ncbi:MAG: response regulator [Nitrospirae bacterium]|nr:response regulator [Nitrospirota bacterium]